MAEVIDKISGYYGYTVDVSDNSNDKNGNVDKALVVISYPPQVTDVDIEIAKGDDDWAIKTGDGQIIPCKNPTPLYINRDNTVIELTMHDGYSYPSNSPCTLVYHSDTASFGVKNLDSSKGTEFPSSSGHWGYTIEGYKGKDIKDNDFDDSQINVGLVNKVMVVVPFPYTTSPMRIDMSDGANDWGIRMGDGSTIPLTNREIVAINQDNFIALFSMKDGYSYPSNSPGVLMYMSESASIRIDGASDDDLNFYPVTSIYNLPTSMISGQTLDLHLAQIEPFNATYQEIQWKVKSGPGSISDGHFLYATAGGTIQISGTVQRGKGETSDFTANFSISVEQNEITINAQPLAEMDTIVGEVNFDISVEAVSKTSQITYQWYQNDVDTTANAQEIRGATNSVYRIPTSLTRGDYYFFCKISSDGAVAKWTNPVHLHVADVCTSIKIMPRVTSMNISSKQELFIELSPATAEMREIVWEVDDNKWLDIEDKGNGRCIITTKVTPANQDKEVVVKATRYDGKASHVLEDTLTITIEKFIPVTDITGVTETSNPGTTVDLDAVVSPSNATHRDIKWSIVSQSFRDDPYRAGNNIETGCTLNGSRLSIPASVNNNYHNRWVKIRATIEQGTSEEQSFDKEFLIRIRKGFIAVTDINLNNFGTGDFYVGDSINLSNSTTVPDGATNCNISWKVSSGPGSISNGRLTFTEAGTVKVIATVSKGRSETSDYTKTFTFNVTVNNNVFTPVTNVDLDITKFNPHSVNPHDEEDPAYDPDENPTGHNPYKLPITVNPGSATNKEYTVKLIRTYENIRDEIETRSIVIYDFVTIDKSGVIYVNTDKMTFDMNPIVELEITVKNGLGDDNDYVETKLLSIVPPKEPDKIIYIEDISLELPSPLRAMYPILASRLTFLPWNYVNDKPIVIGVTSSTDEEHACINTFFDPSSYDFFCEFKSSKFDWDLQDLYIFPWNSGKIDVDITASGADTVDHNDPYCTEMKDYKKLIELNILEPYVPIQSIVNIPEEIIHEGSGDFQYALSPEFLTYSYHAYNMYWDEEVPTYTNIIWENLSQGVSLADPNSGDGVLNIPGSINFNQSFRIDAKVKDGRYETIKWYGKTIDGTDYTQTFDIKIRAATNNDYNNPTASETVPFLKLTLNDSGNSVVNVTTFAELSFICSNLPSTASFKIGEKSIQKKDIKKIEFVNADNKKQIKVTSLRNFARNCVNLTEVVGSIPATVTGDNCLRDFMRGCQSFNGTITIPNTVCGGTATMMNFMRGCISFNQAITIPTSITGKDCLHGFLYGCTKFNQSVTIPSGVTGESSLERFLYGCIKFNQPITIPANITGVACLRDFLALCYEFNQPITLPTNCADSYMMGSILKDCKNMCSEVTVPDWSTFTTEPNFAIAFFNEQSFSCRYKDSAMIKNGIKLVGNGATKLKNMLTNFDEIPRRNLKV